VLSTMTPGPSEPPTPTDRDLSVSPVQRLETDGQVQAALRSIRRHGCLIRTSSSPRIVGQVETLLAQVWPGGVVKYPSQLGNANHREVLVRRSAHLPRPECRPRVAGVPITFSQLGRERSSQALHLAVELHLPAAFVRNEAEKIGRAHV